MGSRSWMARAFGASLASTLAVSVANAGPALVDTQGFESPPFTVGAPLEGQQGWLVAGGGASSAVVQAGAGDDGSNALQVNRTSSSDKFWADPLDTPPSGRFVTIDWDMRVLATGAASGFGPFFGVNVFDDTNGIALVASLGVDATTLDVLVQQTDSGVLVETGQSVLSGEWRRYRIVLDFADDTYEAYLGDTLLTSAGFVDRSFGIDRLTDADIVAFAAGDGVSQSLAGTAYFDNFLVRDGLPGDYTGDGLVDAADYTRWRDQQGSVGFGLSADGDADGDVDADDYGVWTADFGQSNALAPATATPEPASSLLAILTAACIPAGRRQRR